MMVMIIMEVMVMVMIPTTKIMERKLYFFSFTHTSALRCNIIVTFHINESISKVYEVTEPL